MTLDAGRWRIRMPAGDRGTEPFVLPDVEVVVPRTLDLRPAR